MAEDFVSRDQHRADLAELRLEIANSLASLDKRTEILTQTVSEMRTQMDRQFTEMRTQMDRQFTDLRQDMRELRSTAYRQLWIMVGVVTFAVLAGLIKLVFFP